MDAERLARLLAAGVLTATLLIGCFPSRTEYFSSLHRSRERAFRRWQNGQEHEEERPRLEGRLNLKEAIRIAFQYNPQLLAAVQDKARAGGRLWEAYSEALPKLDLSANYTRLDQVPTIDLGVQSFQIGDEDQYSYQVDIEQPLFRGGSIPAAIRGASLFSYLSDEKVRGTVEQVAYRVAQAYFDTVLAQRQIEVQEAALESAEAFLEQVESRREAGVAVEYDVLRARVDVSNIQADLIEQRNRRDMARTRLLRAMGASQKSDVELVTEMSYRSEGTGFSEAVARAFENRPDIYQAALNVDLQEEALIESYSRYWPRLSAYYWHLWAKPKPHEASQIDWGTQWQTGLSLTWPLFDGLEREGIITQRKAELRKTRILLEDTEQKALLEVKNALLDLQNADQLVESQKLNLKRADRALDLVKAGYKEGINTELEVLDARSALTRARGLYYQSLHRHVSGRLELQRAMGILGPPPGAEEVPTSTDQIGIQTLLPAGEGDDAAGK